MSYRSQVLIMVMSDSPQAILDRWLSLVGDDDRPVAEAVLDDVEVGDGFAALRADDIAWYSERLVGTASESRYATMAEDLFDVFDDAVSTGDASAAAFLRVGDDTDDVEERYAGDVADLYPVAHISQTIALDFGLLPSK